MDTAVRTKKSKPVLARELASGIAELYFLIRPTYSEDLTHQSVRLLQFIYMSPIRPRIDDIRNYLQIAPTSASEIVKRLAVKGLVSRTRSEVDERVVELQLTEKGLDALEHHTKVDIEKLADCLKRLRSEDATHLASSFEKLLEEARRQATQLKTQ